MSHVARIFCIGLLAVGASAADAQTVSGTTHRTTGNTATKAMVSAPATALSPRERGGMARQFVLKWGVYVQRVYGVPVGTWSKRMIPTFATVDGMNFQNALKRNTYEGAMAELSGTGRKLADEAVITRMAKAGTLAVTESLGSTTSDLVFTPMQPCRILDTRLAGGTIAAGGSRDFVSVNQANFTSQGGSATDCGTLGLNASAVVISLAATNPTTKGFATLYPFGTTKPLAATITWQAGQLISNTVITKIPTPLTTSDFTIYSNSQAHFVADIVGYFAPPTATALDCTSTFVSQNIAGNDIFDIEIPACAAGYTIAGAGCRTPGFQEADWAINGLYRNGSGDTAAFCSGTNKTAGTITVEGTAQCCRVPGR
ncbi:hypothetical protein [Lysobacter fragariae]